ncbi:cytochrome C1 heme lyase [Vararia minispora EC-137]|uniref:Cytochrome C1 heme lyase n=1 Tax=Vararia minispora EC-137 TaxID=1314806 RepID=A0ACB8QW39_9AGAM|nr:cytochrome C1 heme lyase [Vararia minispora EC-137]
MADKCPVDHVSVKPEPKCPVDHRSLPSNPEACPVDHTTRSVWPSAPPHSSESPSVPLHHAPASLSTDREISSIPRLNDDKWVYPSEAQFFAAMARKNHNPHAPDMKVVVPIHNAVNERAWGAILRWEGGRGGEACGGPRLVSFKGRPQDLTPKARIFSLLGYTPPFDRHDWIVDRCGTRIRYVIDFYTGRNSTSGVSFYLDARPALDNWEGVKMRTQGWSPPKPAPGP